jgi:hypothetical protein
VVEEVHPAEQLRIHSQAPLEPDSPLPQQEEQEVSAIWTG